MFDWAFQGVAWLMATFYGWVPDYAFAIALMAVVVMLVLTPLTLKSTKGMLEMQRLQPEMRRRNETPIAPSAVSDAATTFLDGLVRASGASGRAVARVEGEEIDINIEGDDLAFLVGNKGQTLTALQDLTRVVSQRRLGDHETRLKVDVAGYRERRKAALTRFALKVAEDVREAGEARALEPMNAADRKVVHDALAEVADIVTRSQGSDPFRRVVVALAAEADGAGRGNDRDSDADGDDDQGDDD